jgi:hypothetical protein
MQKLEDALWDLGQVTTQDGINCNAGLDPCQYGRPGEMTIVEPSQADADAFRKTVQNAVLPTWLADCERVYAPCRAVWNDSVGRVIGLSI